MGKLRDQLTPLELDIDAFIEQIGGAIAKTKGEVETAGQELLGELGLIKTEIKATKAHLNEQVDQLEGEYEELL